MLTIQRIALVALALILSAPLVARAQGSARASLQQRHEEVNRILRESAETDAARQRRSRRLTRLLADLLDYRAVSEAALGDHWVTRSEEQRDEFVSLLRQLVEQNYETNLERILDYEVTYGDERRRGGHTLVTTSARSRTQRRQPAVEIEYTMANTGGAWRVVDVTTDGVSMVRNYRDQFGRVIERDGWDDLIARMRRRLGDS